MNEPTQQEIDQANEDLCKDGFGHDYLIVWTKEAPDGTCFVKKRCTVCGKTIEGEI